MQHFARRRKQLVKAMGENTLAIVASQPERLRNGDAHYPYRQNSDFYYLTGFAEAESFLVLQPGQPQAEFVLFNRPRDAAVELWDGPRAGQQGACEHYGADQAFHFKVLEEKMLSWLAGKTTVYVSFQASKLHAKLAAWLQTLAGKLRSGVTSPPAIKNLDLLVHEMRLYKDAEEVKLLQKASNISVAAHQAAMQACRPGMFEYQLEAELLHQFVQQGARYPAYESIVAAGENACVLHYKQNNQQIKSNDLVLIDAGCEYQYYAADITRTFPANGRFSGEQRAVYEIVLAAQKAAIAAVKPGLGWDQLQVISDRVITDGLRELGLLQGSLDDLLAENACRAFYPHRSGHWLGLDVHDVAWYKQGSSWRQLAAGMYFTVEPGIYISSKHKVDARWHGIGVRIEDNVLVTPQGHRVLTEALEKDCAAIEQRMAG